jgi:hypothetical protein
MHILQNTHNNCNRVISKDVKFADIYWGRRGHFIVVYFSPVYRTN